MRNLVDNALKYTQNGGEVVLTSNRIDDKIKLMVTENGQAIKEELLPKLFILSP